MGIISYYITICGAALKEKVRLLRLRYNAEYDILLSARLTR